MKEKISEREEKSCSRYVILFCMAAAISLLAFGNAYAGCDELPAGVLFTPETGNLWFKTHCTADILEIIRQRDLMIPIPGDEPFNSGQAGITWEEFLNLPRVAGLEIALEHHNREIEHGPTLGDIWGNPSGNNTFNYNSALLGDILLLHDGSVPWGFFRHAGMYNGSNTILEADPTYGVHIVGTGKFLGYDQQYGIKPVVGYGTYAASALSAAKIYEGAPYSTDYWNKYRTDRFYCSSLIWRGYMNGTGWDIDFDGEGLVLPDDIYRYAVTPSSLLHIWQYAL